MDLDPVAVGSTLIRLVNAIIWTLLCIKIYKNGVPVISLVRTMFLSVFFFGMWVFVIGSLTAYGFPGEAARFIYTAFTAYSLVIALAIISGD